MWRFSWWWWYPHRLRNILLVFNDDWRLWSNANSSRIDKCIYSNEKVLALNSHLNRSNFDFLTLSIEQNWFAHHFAQVEYLSLRPLLSLHCHGQCQDTLKRYTQIDFTWRNLLWKIVKMNLFQWFDLADTTTFSRLQIIVSLENTYWIDDVYAAWSAGRNVF